jgi:alpha-glucoside transport system permease protein
MGGTLLTAILAVAGGVGGAVALFWVGNWILTRIGGRWEDRLKPLLFFGPALAVVMLFLAYPLLDTVRRTFFADRAVRGRGREFVGLDNYRDVLTDSETWGAVFNNLLWMIVVPVGAVAVGLVVAVLADRLKPRWENVAKAVIFLPMAISFVGAAVIWGLVYRIESVGDQTGLLNAILVAVGFDPVAFFEVRPFNNFALMVIMIWLQAGFAMVLLSAAIKNVPEDTIEAARIDGATELQVFFKVTMPQIKSTIVVVATTILILVLKIFDIVRVTTNGRFETQVVANYFFTKFEMGHYGTAGVVVVLLVVMTIPFMILNVKRFREQEAMR